MEIGWHGALLGDGNNLTFGQDHICPIIHSGFRTETQCHRVSNRRSRLGGDLGSYWRNHLAPEKYRVAMLDGVWELIAAEDLSSFELYNLRKDWQESNDLSTKYPAQFAELKRNLIAHDAAVFARQSRLVEG